MWDWLETKQVITMVHIYPVIDEGQKRLVAGLLAALKGEAETRCGNNTRLVGTYYVVAG